MKTLPLIISSLLLISLCLGCKGLIGEEIGRLKINKVSTDDKLTSKEISLDLKKGQELVIWSDMDVEYDGEVSFELKLEISRNGEHFGQLTLDPTKKNVTLGETKIAIMDNTKWSFLGRNKKIDIKEDGQYTFKGILIASENESLTVHKAELIFKR